MLWMFPMELLSAERGSECPWCFGRNTLKNLGFFLWLAFISLWFPWKGTVPVGTAAAPGGSWDWPTWVTWAKGTIHGRGERGSSQEMGSEGGKVLQIHPASPFSLDNFRSWKSLPRAISRVLVGKLGECLWPFSLCIPHSGRWVGDRMSFLKDRTTQKTSHN